MTEIFLILDRIEENVAVFTDTDGKIYECGAVLLGASKKENGSFLAKLDENGKIISISEAENHTTGENKKRLRNLFERHKDK